MNNDLIYLYSSDKKCNFGSFLRSDHIIKGLASQDEWIH